MSRVFQEEISRLSELSGCDWDFLVDMYNHIHDTKRYGVDWDRFWIGVIMMDWSARGNGRFQEVLEKLSEDSGYEYDFLFKRLTDMVYDPDDDSDWDYFVGITMEHDW